MIKQKRVRSPRFSVPNKERVVVSIEAKQFNGTLHLLSRTGGAVRLDKRVASCTLADIRINTVSGNFSASIEFLQMANGNAQAFRFIAMGAVERKRLEEALNKMREQGLAVDKTPLDQFRKLARRVLSRIER